MPASWAQGRPARSPRSCAKSRPPTCDDALARTLLTITFDGAETPQVAVPLGEFFGSGPGLNPFEIGDQPGRRATA